MNLQQVNDYKLYYLNLMKLNTILLLNHYLQLNYCY